MASNNKKTSESDGRITGGWDADGLRTRYRPRNRIGQSLISAAPWVNIVLLVLFFMMLESKITLQPGFVIELPDSRFNEGLRSGMQAVVFSLQAPSGWDRQEVVFFDDVQFWVNNSEQMIKLKYAFADHMKKDPESGLIIQADSNVKNGTLTMLYDMACEAGVKMVDIALHDTARPDGNKK